MTKIRIQGSRAAVDKLKRELEEEAGDQWEAGNVEVAALDPMNRQPVGMDPETYFYIVFTAHLSAEIVTELGKAIIRRATRIGLSAKDERPDAGSE